MTRREMETGAAAPIDIAALRRKLSDASGPEFWRSLDELAETEEFSKFVAAEFPSQAPQLLDPLERRQFLKLMGASLALAGVSACTRQPEERIYPYSQAPEHVVPGKPLYFATAIPLAGVANGVLVESHMGRPTKVEGNPEHPASAGATDCFAQASILGLYDPDRSRTIRHAGSIRPWAAFAAAAAAAMEKQRDSEGAGLRILTGAVTSPTLVGQIGDILADYPRARWIQYEPVTRETSRTAARAAFGRDVDSRYRLDRAAVVLSLDADFLGSGRGGLRYARDFARTRRERANRLYAVEPTPSNTGAAADHRLPLRADLVEEIAVAVAVELGLPVRSAVGVEEHRAWINAVARDLEANRGRSLVIAGEWQTATTQLLAHAINARLQAAGNTVEYSQPIDAGGPAGLSALRELCDEMERGEVEVLVIAGSNPAYDAPADLDFAARMQRVATRIHLGLYDDETAHQCHWHIPESHPLEAWSDARSYDGTVTIMQPLIAPLYGGRSLHELLATLTGHSERKSYDIVRSYWQDKLPEPFEDHWRRAVHDGVVAGTRFESLQPNWLAPPGTQLPSRTEEGIDAGWELVLRPDGSAFDGRFANNGWMQELPRPITRLAWGNAALIAPSAAQRLQVSNGDVVEITAGGRSVRAPVWIVPGQASDTITLHLGYGRRRGGRLANGVGADAYALRTTTAPWTLRSVRVTRTGDRQKLACTQDHFAMEGRDLIRVESSAGDAGKAHGGAHGAGPHGDTSLFPPVEYKSYAWGMSIDLGSCIGCNACVVSCQAENNIPVVGKEQVDNGREMHWLRIDRYFAGDLDAPEILQQPVPCMHCELAPCEIVCPVNATVHSDEGLNDMVYNRCVGTRYCSNNCPYKVRRFNFLLYNTTDSDVLKMAANPDVTVRSRGVMEKCTYCVQRISHARIAAKKEGRPIRDGEVVTACQAVCPTEAIVFGDINDPDSAVSKAKASPGRYALLDELGNKPRTTYLPVWRNPNPELLPPAERT